MPKQIILTLYEIHTYEIMINPKFILLYSNIKFTNIFTD